MQTEPDQGATHNRLRELRERVAELEKNRLECKRMEEVLRESEAKLRQIIDLVPHMIFVKDWDGKYSW